MNGVRRTTNNPCFPRITTTWASISRRGFLALAEADVGGSAFDMEAFLKNEVSQWPGRT